MGLESDFSMSKGTTNVAEDMRTIFLITNSRLYQGAKCLSRNFSEKRSGGFVPKCQNTGDLRFLQISMA
jgi:hypothetical protein